MSTKRRLFIVALVVAAVVGVWLRADALHGGFHGDDYVHVAMLEGKFPVERSPFDLYRFADVERDGTALADAGYHPWWAAADLRIAMCRPLSSALLWVDHALFGTDAFYYHVHSFVWWFLVLAAAGLVLFHVLPAPAALVAVVLFGIDESHAGAAVWIANRATSVATCFALVGVYLHVRYREERTPLRVGLEVLAFTVALLGGEYALSTMAYVIAYEFVGRDDDENQRLVAMLPAVGPTVVYLGLRRLLDFGVRSSGYYIDPLQSPREFIRGALERVPVLMGESVLGFPARAFVDLPKERPVQIAWGVAAIVLLAVVAWWFRRRGDQGLHLTVSWLALGAVLAGIPTAGALPEDRLLVASSFGVLACAGLVVAVAIRPGLSSGGAGRWGIPGLLAIGVFIVHGLFAARVAWGRAAWFGAMAPMHEAWSLDADIPDDPSAKVLFLSGADFTTNANLPYVRVVRGHPRPKWYRRLSGSNQVQEIQRIAEDQFELVILSSDVGETMAGSLYRPKDQPMRRGETYRIAGMSALVLHTIGANPWRVRFTFDEPLDDVVLVHAMPDGMRRVDMPAVGGKLRLPYPAAPQLP